MSGWAIAGQAAASLLDTYIQKESNRSEAKKNREFQERMSNTAYQRAAADMEAAGLNRILAASSPASTPSGSQAAITSPDLGRAISTGIAAASAKQQIAQSQAQTALLTEQEKTEGFRQELAKQQSEQARTQALSNAENARKTRLDADRAEVFNPAYKAAGDVVDWSVDKLKSTAKQFDDSAIKREIDGVIDAVVNRTRNVKRNSDGIESGSYRDRLDKWYKSRK